jgi:tRNA 2-thiocytidine biosynthesis protein TtcA
MERKNIKNLLKQWQKEHPGRIDNIFSAICNIAPSQLGDRTLFDFESLQQHQNRNHLYQRLDLAQLD